MLPMYISVELTWIWINNDSHSIDSLCICVDLAFIILLKFCDIGGIHGIFTGSIKSVKQMQQLVAADTFIILVALKNVFANVCLVKLSIYYVHPVFHHRSQKNAKLFKKKKHNPENIRSDCKSAT